MSRPEDQDPGVMLDSGGLLLIALGLSACISIGGLVWLFS